MTPRLFSRRLALALLTLLAGSAPGVLPLAGQTVSPSPPPSAGLAPELALERLQWSREVDGENPIAAIEVRNDFGDIRARLAGDRKLEAWMVVQRLDPGPQRLGFTVERRGPVVALMVSYPPGRVRDVDPHPPKDSYDRLDLALFVPRGVALRAHTLRGQVEARGLESDVEAATLDGPIFVTTNGQVQARTDGGELRVHLGAALASPGAPMVLRSKSGPITLTLPARADAELRVETAGALRAAVAMRRTRRTGRIRATALLGRPQRLLLVTSDTGPVTIDHAPR